ncbi:hypothetical protein M1L60_03505 [Actinoplanes sp. TRM 88003]|uniref:DUF3558 domain-containing protein n=1 Tax=Paractinoplanes aksuensis TaxID=2939490 RepID=A0ABT1DFT5_9ACTN|nr:hypothetical protein [Actinoplanes aksuensis]MCO8269655.1 hypothetical protein [Actinoplanes aksuensis]
MEAPVISRRRRRVLIAVMTVVFVVAAVFTAYLAGVFDDEGDFRTEPEACTSLQSSMPRLGAPYVAKPDGKNNCDLWLPDSDGPKLTVAYAVISASRGDAPDAASTKLREFAPLGFVELPNLADEAYIRVTSLYFRVSNLLVGITVYPEPASTQAAVQTFARDLAEQLRA